MEGYINQKYIKVVTHQDESLDTISINFWINNNKRIDLKIYFKNDNTPGTHKLQNNDNELYQMEHETHNFTYSAYHLREVGQSLKHDNRLKQIDHATCVRIRKLRLNRGLKAEEISRVPYN